MTFIDWQFNHNDDTGVCYISENIISTPLVVEVGKNNTHVCSWEFIYGSVSNPILSHKMSFTIEEVISKFNGSINEAKIKIGYIGWLHFKKKLEETTAYDDGSGENVDAANRINK